MSIIAWHNAFWHNPRGHQCGNLQWLYSGFIIYLEKCFYSAYYLIASMDKQQEELVKYYMVAVTSGTCRCRWELTRKWFSGSWVIRKARAKVEAIFALSFITSPSWPTDIYLYYAFCSAFNKDIRSIPNIWLNSTRQGDWAYGLSDWPVTSSDPSPLGSVPTDGRRSEVSINSVDPPKKRKMQSVLYF